MSREGLSIRYYEDTDTLVFRIAESPGYGETVAPDLWVMYDRDGEVSKVTIEHAAKQLPRHLFPGEAQEGKVIMNPRDMEVTYEPETDTLRLQTGDPPYSGFTEKTVAPGLCVNFHPDGRAMGVVIEQAAKLLRPYLSPEGAEVV